MKISRIGRKLLYQLMAVAFGSAVTYVILRTSYEAEIADLKEKISEMEETEHNALVTKRISEQMEDIAYQQKSISDMQRERAEEQSRIADMERGKAELERSLAREAERKAHISEHEAILSRKEAEKQTELAELHLEAAQAARAQADTLFYNSLGRSLAQTSVSEYNVGNSSLSALLSYSAWYYTTQYGGNVYQQDVFESLIKTSGADMSVEADLRGDIRALSLTSNDNGGRAILAVTDYGEIALMPATVRTQWGSGIKTKTEVIYRDSKYDFRNVLMVEKDHGLVLDINGVIADVTYGLASRCVIKKQSLVNDHWHSLLKTADGSVVAVGEHTVAWLSADFNTVTRTEYIDGTVTAVGQRGDDHILLFCEGGMCYHVTGGAVSSYNNMPWLSQDNASAYIFSQYAQYDLIGAESGKIYVCDMDGHLVTTFVGHHGRISSMDQFSRMVMTSSYDRSVRIWDMRNVNTMIASNEVSFDKWPLCLQYDGKEATLQIGLADGSLHLLNISAKSNAERTRSKITREFTPDEWNYYIGNAVEYKTFMP